MLHAPSAALDSAAAFTVSGGAHMPQRRYAALRSRTTCHTAFMMRGHCRCSASGAASRARCRRYATDTPPVGAVTAACGAHSSLPRAYGFVLRASECPALSASVSPASPLPLSSVYSPSSDVFAARIFSEWNDSSCVACGTTVAIVRQHSTCHRCSASSYWS